LSGRQAFCGELSRLDSLAYAHPHAATAPGGFERDPFCERNLDLISAIPFLNHPLFSIPDRRLSGLPIFPSSARTQARTKTAKTTPIANSKPITLQTSQFLL
jgi:hypothetical protein